MLGETDEMEGAPEPPKLPPKLEALLARDAS
jgi:hypothetical protein